MVFFLLGLADVDIPVIFECIILLYILNPAVLQMLLIFMTKHRNKVFSVSFLYVVAYNGELYIFGGYNARLDRHFNDLWKFNPGKFGKSMMSCRKATKESPAMITLTGSNCVFSLFSTVHYTVITFILWKYFYEDAKGGLNRIWVQG